MMVQFAIILPVIIVTTLLLVALLFCTKCGERFLKRLGCISTKEKQDFNSLGNINDQENSDGHQKFGYQNGEMPSWLASYGQKTPGPVQQPTALAPVVNVSSNGLNSFNLNSNSQYGLQLGQKNSSPVKTNPQEDNKDPADVSMSTINGGVGVEEGRVNRNEFSKPNNSIPFANTNNRSS